MRRLTGLDASFLYLESATSPMHVAGTYVFDADNNFDFDRFKELIGNRLHKLPPFRWRLVEVPFGLHHPIWIEDPEFDLDYHVRRMTVRAPGGRKELEEAAAELMSRPLDRRRPLWEIHIIEGLEKGHVAMVSKTHHAAIDGASGAELSTNMLDTAPEPTWYTDAPTWTAERIPSDVEMVSYAWNSLIRQPAKLVDTIKQTVSMVTTLRNRPKVEGIVSPPAPFSAPRTSFNIPLTSQRSFGTAEVSLADIKRIRGVLGGTVNDVVLALCASALRRYLIDNSELPVEPLVAMVPISVRANDQQGAMGNRVSNMFVALPTNVADPFERLQLIQESTKASKDQANAIGADTLSNWIEFAAPAIAARAARLYSSMRLADRHRPIFNVTISNVPGPNFPLYCNGSKLVSWYPMGPIFDGGGLNMTVMSYMGVVHFGLVACTDALPNVRDLAADVLVAAAELLKAADDAEAAAQATVDGVVSAMDRPKKKAKVAVASPKKSSTKKSASTKKAVARAR
jgi:diacylglycerol O-acyltransferase / wax synthase